MYFSEAADYVRFVSVVFQYLKNTAVLFKHFVLRVAMVMFRVALLLAWPLLSTKGASQCILFINSSAM